MIPPISPVFIPVPSAIEPRVIAPAPATLAVTLHPPMPPPRKDGIQQREKREREQEQPRRRKRGARGARADLKA